MLSKFVSGPLRAQRVNSFQQWAAMTSVPMRSISSKAQLQSDNEKVKLRGRHLPGRQKDLPTLIWLPELVESANNFEQFFMRKDNKVRDVRNVWLLNYRNQGDSDHHTSYDMDHIADDIVRFMDENQITMATIGGHGFGAKVAAATAIKNLDRFTGVISLEGGPLNHKYYESYQELESYVKLANSLDIANMELGKVHRALDNGISCPKWRAIFKQNLTTDKSTLEWKFNVTDLVKDMNRHVPNVCHWGENYGLWPGQALAIFAAQSRWVHLATNTLPFYNVFPRLQGQFPGHISTWADDDSSPLNHWLHEHPPQHVWQLSQRLWRWLRYHDGCNVNLADKTEAGWFYVPDRGYCAETNTRHGEYTPEHVHHNYLHTKEYEKSRERRGKEGAEHGEFLPVGKYSPEDKWF